MHHSLTGSQPQLSEDLSTLQIPTREAQRLVVIGGGHGGLVATNSLLRSIEAEKEILTRSGTSGGASRFRGLGSVSLLTGDNSLAFSPVSGEFGSFLTLSGCDHIRRDVELENFRSRIGIRLERHGFSYNPGVLAQRIQIGREKAFEIETASRHGPSLVRADKLVLAIGHTLKERPIELAPYLFRGAAEICQRLSDQRRVATSQKDCLSRLLSNLRPMPDGSISIGLVGLGSSFLEVIKIFHTLLDPPDTKSPLYQVPSTGRPVRFVLYDSRLAHPIHPEKALLDGIEIFLSNAINPDPSKSVESETLFLRYKEKERARISSLVRTGQLRVIPHRFDWDKLSVTDSSLLAHSKNGEATGLSALVDCSPFQVGLSSEQKSLLANISALNFSKHQEGGWMARVADPTFKNRLALIGGAFTEKSDWAMGPILSKARDIVDRFFPRTGATSLEEELKTHTEKQPYDR